MVSGRTVINALIGAVVGVVLSFIPFSTVVGGAVAGFLEGPDAREGTLVGVLVGAVTFVPFAAIALLVLAALGFGVGVAAVPVEGFAFVFLAFALASSIVLLYTVGLAALGGYLGAYLAREYPDQRTRTRRAIGMDARRREPHRPTRPRRRGRRADRYSDRPESDVRARGAWSLEDGSDDGYESDDPTRWRDDRDEIDRELERETDGPDRDRDG